MTSSIIAATTATHIEQYAAIVPDGFVTAHIIDPDSAPLGGKAWGACNICGRPCHDHHSNEWWRVIDRINDGTHERRYHKECLTKQHSRREVLSVLPVEGAVTKVGEGITVVYRFLPLYDEGEIDEVTAREIAACFLTPNRQAAEKDVTETSGVWFALDEGGYISPRLNNCKTHRRLITVAPLVPKAILTTEIYLDGVYVGEFDFEWGNEREQGRFISEYKSKQGGFLVMQDWEVGKYRKHGRQQYNYEVNIERAREERDYGVWPRELFWL